MHPYLRAANAGLRHHARQFSSDGSGISPVADRAHLDLLHAHLIACHQLAEQLADATHPQSPAAGRALTAVGTRLWQAAAALHDAFHTLPLADATTRPRNCPPGRLDGPPFVTICRRHLSAVHAVRRKATASQVDEPLHGHATTCAT
jgi:hypothetical protein